MYMKTNFAICKMHPVLEPDLPTNVLLPNVLLLPDALLLNALLSNVLPSTVLLLKRSI